MGGDAGTIAADRELQRATTGVAEGTRFVIFVWFFAAFSLIHEIIDARHWVQDGVFAISGGVLSLVAACLVIAKPTSAVRLILLIVGLLIVKIDAMPFTPNHVLFTSLVCLLMLLALATRPRATSWPGWLARTAGPAIRAGVVVVYLFAVLHKLNSDYFNPNASCATTLFKELREYIPFVPTGSWINWPTILGSLATEFGLAIFLAVPRTRTLAIAYGLLFHGLLAFHPNVYVMSFSTLIIPLYSIFLPLECYERLAEMARDFRQRWPSSQLWNACRYAPLVLVIAVTAYVAIRIVMSGETSPSEMRLRVELTLRFFPRLIATGFVLMSSAAFFAAILTKPGLLRSFDRFRDPIRWPAAALCSLLVFNGFSPYLGTKTQTSFSMFSNLRTEAGRTNHFFMPTWLRISDETLDMVSIQKSSAETLKRYENTGELIPFFELRRAAANDHTSNFEIVYTPMGSDQPLTATRSGISDDEAMRVFEEPSLLMRKVVGFRGVPPLDEPCTCRH